jgi:molybdenum cofactor cytidylyltransferase
MCLCEIAMSKSRLFAVIPAAGQSRRMGRAKLLLPFQGTTVIGRLLETLAEPRIAARCIVVRRDDDRLRREAEAHNGWVISPEVDPPDMRASVAYAIEEIARRFAPNADDGWLLIPADHPVLPAELLVELLDVWDRDQPEIVVPTYNGRRGHPTLFRWEFAKLLGEIPADCGLNWLLARFADRLLELPCRYPEAVQDLDTPEDYARLLGRPDSDGARKGSESV